MASLDDGLALNPLASIAIQDGVDPPVFLVSAPVRGVAFMPHPVTSESLPEAHAFLVATLIEGRPENALSDQGFAELQQIGLFAPAELLPQLVHYPFPASTLGEHRDAPKGHWTFPECTLRIPEEWKSIPLDFEPHFPGGIWSPVQGSLNSPRRNEPSGPPEMDGDETRAQFEREGFAMLPNLLPHEHVSALGIYFQALAKEGFLEVHDDRGTIRHIAHNHPVADFWHDQLNARISHLVGRKTKPSYTYVSLYIEGGNLEWHTDRSPCEYTITLLLDYSPLRADGRSPWALKVKGRDGTIHELHQKPGDALIFKGRELMHSREVLPKGHRSASLLFHFVDHDYEGIMV